jgi:hypothetical protein
MSWWKKLACLVVLSLIPAFPAAASVTGFEVVISGDSIIRLSESHVMGAGRYVDAEDGRQVNIPGTSGRLSSTGAVRLMIPHVQPGGWFIFQDNGAHATTTEWRALLKSIVAQVPADRCLLGVLPVWIAPGPPATTADIAAKANIMVHEFNLHPCHEYVRWNQQVNANPSLVYDGQHPTAAGAAWIGAQITIRTGHVIGGGSCL